MFAEHLVQDRLAEDSGCCGERYEVPQIGGQGMGLGKTNELCAVRLFSSGLPSPLLTPNPPLNTSLYHKLTQKWTNIERKEGHSSVLLIYLQG